MLTTHANITFGSIAASVQQNGFGAARMLVEERSCVEHLAVDNNPTIVFLVVFRHFRCRDVSAIRWRRWRSALFGAVAAVVRRWRRRWRRGTRRFLRSGSGAVDTALLLPLPHDTSIRTLPSFDVGVTCTDALPPTAEVPLLFSAS